ncbi:uncharacterized protein [Procambarus clarkii]|uniref:uncharacterized protein isoform X1 n=1 Tax=Procambarus clarkii TaxID=6728 RepID=UPI003742F91D
METSQPKQSFIASSCTQVHEEKGLITYQINSETIHDDDENKIRVMTIGPMNNQPIKAVLLLGETGAGKTQLVNAMVNYLFGVQLEDNFRFQLKDEIENDGLRQIESQTEYITAYIVYHQEGMAWNSNYMLIDTPGFGDTRENDKKIQGNRIRFFLSNSYHINDLNCFGLVVKANQNRNTNWQMEMLKEYASILSGDIANITQILATFASDEPLVKGLLEHAGIQFVNLYKIDNELLYAPHDDDSARHAYVQYKWKRTQKEYASFFNEIQNSSVNLKQTRELLQLKTLLEETKATLLRNVDQIATVKNTIRQQKTSLQDMKIKQNCINYTKITLIKEPENYDIGDNHHAHNCYLCKPITTCYICENPPIGKIIREAVAAGTAAGVVVSAAVKSQAGVVAGAATGAAAAVVTGIHKGIGTYRENPKCLIPLNGICGENNCYHDLKDHKKETKPYKTTETYETHTDIYEKKRYDKLKEEILKLTRKIQHDEEALGILKDNLETDVEDLVKHCRNISKLSLRCRALNPESIIEEMLEEHRDNVHKVEVLKTLKVKDCAMMS